MRPFFLCLFLLVSAVECGKIGIFTVAFSSSQMVFTHRVAETLADDGHEVVIIRPTYNPKADSIKTSHPKIREIFAKGAPLEAWEKYNIMKHRENFEEWAFFEYREWSNAIRHLIIESCKNIVANDELLQQIKDENFDLVFNHHYDFCTHGLAHAAGVRKWIYTMPLPLHAPHLENLGIPYFNSFIPGLIENVTMIKTFSQRAQTVIGDLVYRVVSGSAIENPTDKIFKEKFGSDFIDVAELKKTAIMSFVNSDPFLEYPIPTTNKVQYIGGLGMKNPKPLKEPFLSFSEKAKTLVVVSFGSVVTASDMPEKWRNAILGLFRLNPEISFIWKFEKEIEVPENVLRTAWFPQNDVLALNKTVAFVTHGGYNSLGEAVQTGTPCVFVPLSTDQARNSMLGQFRGIGIQLPKRDLTAENLNFKLQEILTNPEYKENVQKYQKLSKSRINTPEEVLRYWTNLAIKHNLNLDLPDQSFIALYNVDVYILFCAIGVILIFIGWVLLRLLYRLYYWSCCEMAYKEKEKLQ